MSKTYIGAILQFLVTIGLVTGSELTQLTDAVVAGIAIIPLLITLYGRIKVVEKVSWLGLKK